MVIFQSLIIIFAFSHSFVLYCVLIKFSCYFQVIVQRALAAKSLSHAQGATLLAGFIKILPFFIMVLPGVISRVLYTG